MWETRPADAAEGWGGELPLCFPRQLSTAEFVAGGLVHGHRLRIGDASVSAFSTAPRIVGSAVRVEPVEEFHVSFSPIRVVISEIAHDFYGSVTVEVRGFHVALSSGERSGEAELGDAFRKVGAHPGDLLEPGHPAVFGQQQERAVFCDSPTVVEVSGRQWDEPGGGFVQVAGDEFVVLV